MSTVFPSPLIPLTPLLDVTAPIYNSYPPIPSVLDIKYSCTTVSGRYAIALALQHIGLTPEQIVLIPAYHCEAMVAPVKWLGAKAAFYPINPDTSISFNNIKKRINSNVKAIIATHYFGFLQDLSELRALCDQHGIKLIEDCAHAFFGIHDNHQSVGKIGDYAIASSMKFLPLYEGGILCSETIDLKGVKVTVPALSFQLKSLFNIVERSLAYDRLGTAGKLLNRLLALKNKLWAGLKKINKTPHYSSASPSSSDGGYGLDEEWLHKSASLTSNIIIRLAHLTDSAYRRRQNYQKLHAALANLPNCRPLFSTLPANVVPWAYPLYVKNADQCNIKLRMQGLPLWRFGEFLDAEVNEEICPVSVDYSKHILQFPCHQSLTDQDIAWMIGRITQTLTET